MRTSRKKLMCYTSKNSSPLRKKLHSNVDSSSIKKGCCKARGNKRCRPKPNSCSKKRRMRKNVQPSESVETLQRISSCGSLRCQCSVQLVAHKTSCKCQRVNLKDTAGDDAIKSHKRKRTKRKRRYIERDEASRLQRRARYLLIKMKLEQNLIDAYSGDGWNGQSREKIKPEMELRRAENQILKCKLGIRDAIHQLDLLSSIGSIEDSVMYPDGSVFHEHIFCAKCRSREAFPDNDIILCDGACNCGFHQQCLEPPLEKLPPGDQGWLCKFCECKMEILEAINAHLGTCFTVNDSWEDIFKEATTDPDVEKTSFDHAEEWPSEDSEDEDYNPEMNENSNSKIGFEENVSGDSSSSGSLFCSSDDAMLHSESKDRGYSERSYDVGYENEKNDYCGDSIINIDSGDINDCEIMSYRRQRRDVDYKKLHDEMFGKDPTENDQQSEDEDWGPYRRKRKRIESSADTSTAGCGNEDGCSNLVSNEKKSSDGRRLFRIPPQAVEKLRQVFAENELPSRAVRENLSKELGLSSEKVSKWFKNARYAALKIRKEGIMKPSIISATRKLRTGGKARSSNEVAAMDNSYFLPLSSIIRVPRNLRRILQRKNPKSITTRRNKQKKRTENVLHTDKIQNLKTNLSENQHSTKSIEQNLSKELGQSCQQASAWFVKAVYYKKQVSGLRRKYPLESFSTKRRTVSPVDEMTNNEQLYLIEMERLWNLEGRLQNLKKALVGCRDDKHLSCESHSREQSVIYIPVAELKEKV